MKTPPYTLIAITAFCITTTVCSSQGLNPSLRLVPTRTSLVDGEPVYAWLRIRNPATNAVEVELGKQLLENILLWTASDNSKHQNCHMTGIRGKF